MNYAPILIPTLCRFKHFKSCIESLLNNTGVANTDLIIALDYPLKTPHFNGYYLIINYIDKIVGFKSVNVLKRTKNLGASINSYRAIDEVFKKYDRLIYIEDDLIFSPNFLEFVNKGLQKFKNDDSIFAVSGYAFNLQKIKFGDNNYIKQGISLPVYGLAIWRDRMEIYKKSYTNSLALRKILNPFSLFKILRHSASTFLFLLITVFKEEIFTDSSGSIYMFLEKKNVIQPTISKVKNLGWDGTGNNCRVDESHALQEIDKDTHFNFTGNGNNYYETNNKLLLEGMRNYMPYSTMFGHLFRMIIYRIKNKIKIF